MRRALGRRVRHRDGATQCRRAERDSRHGLEAPLTVRRGRLWLLQGPHVTMAFHTGQSPGSSAKRMTLTSDASCMDNSGVAVRHARRGGQRRRWPDGAQAIVQGRELWLPRATNTAEPAATLWAYTGPRMAAGLIGEHRRQSRCIRWRRPSSERTTLQDKRLWVLPHVDKLV